MATARDDYPLLAAYVYDDDHPYTAAEADRALTEIDRLRAEVARLRQLAPGPDDEHYLGTRSHWPDGTPRR